MFYTQIHKPLSQLHTPTPISLICLVSPNTWLSVVIQCDVHARQGHTDGHHTDYVLSVAFSANGMHVASGSLDMTVRVWDLATGECLRTLKVKPQTLKRESVRASRDSIVFKGCQCVSFFAIISLKRVCSPFRFPPYRRFKNSMPQCLTLAHRVLCPCD